MDNEKLRKIVNSSGFPLQIRIENEVKKSGSGWLVLEKEYAWRDTETGHDGFVDLVLKGWSNALRLIVECKRVRDTVWIFLVPDIEETKPYSTCWFTSKRPQTAQGSAFGWFESRTEPACHESGFCVIQGEDTKSKPMLERIAATLLDATEAVARDEYQLPDNSLPALYFSAIVTTAELQICKFNPDDISTRTGEIAKPEFEQVPFVRFRKSLSTRLSSYQGMQSIKDVNVAKERTIFVINSLSVIDFIRQLKPDAIPYMRSLLGQ